jgi:hypothetical protein
MFGIICETGTAHPSRAPEFCSSSTYGFCSPLWYLPFFLNPSPFYWSTFAKSEKWAFMYMRVRDAYFISVSMIVLFDFGIVLTCGIVLTVWDCSDSVILFWQCGIVLTVWDCSDGVRLFWQCGFVLTVWDCFDSVGLFCQCGIVLTMWDCFDSVELFWQSGIVCFTFYLYNPRFITFAMYDIACSFPHTVNTRKRIPKGQ